MERYFTYTKSFYLCNCDLINKYSLKSSIIDIKLSKIILTLSCDELLKILERNLSSKELEIRTFFITFFLFGINPYIDIKSKFQMSKKIKDISISYKLKITLNNLADIYSFLIFAFIENTNSVINLNEKLSVFTKNNLVYNYKILADSCWSWKNFFKNSNILADLKELLLKIDVVLENKKKIFLTKDVIKMFPFFWVS